MYTKECQISTPLCKARQYVSFLQSADIFGKLSMARAG